jgi:heme ABC exporter ATP-binding subunit CcmA
VTPPAIVARGLSKRFGRVVALDAVELEVARGSVLAVLGPNGAGKSTLLRILAGLARPSAGEVQVEAAAPPRRAAAPRRRERGRVGYLAHATFLYPELTARENLIFAARLHGVPDPGARADALLASHGLTDAAGRRAGAFSRGMAQRLAIARALVHDPPVLLLDEPYTGLDRSAAAALSERVRALREEGRTLVLVTHELARAAELADAALVLSRGRVVHAAQGAALALPVLERAYLAGVEAAA